MPSGRRRGEHDLDQRGQHLGPGRAALRLVQRGADRRGRGSDLTLRQPQQGQPGLRGVSLLAGLAVGLLGLGVPATQPLQLGQLVEGHPDHPWWPRRVGEPVARPTRLLQGVRPGAEELQDLGAVDQALTTERHQVRLGRAPATQRRRPLLGPADVEGLLAHRDHPAVGDACDDRRHFAGSDGDHYLVEQCHALRGLAQPGQRLTSAEPRERRQILIAEAVADLGGLAERGVGRRGVTSGKAPNRDRQEQVPLLGTVQLTIVEQPPGSGEPAAAAGKLAPVQQREAQPERAPGAPRHITRVQPPLKRTRPRVGAVVVPADQVGSHRKPFEIRRLEWCLTVQGRELFIGIRPGLPAERVLGPFEGIGCGHTLSPLEAPRRRRPVHAGTSGAHQVLPPPLRPGDSLFPGRSIPRADSKQRALVRLPLSPVRDPQRFPACPRCKELAGMLGIGG